MKAFDPLGALARLSEHGVHFVLIGGLAARLRGSPTVTDDLDVCHSKAGDNLERLAVALASMHPVLRDADDVTVDIDERFLAAADSFTFSTDFGPLDLLAVPAGTQGYEQLAAGAEIVDLDGLEIKVASLDDLMAMKRTAGRPQDLIELEVLGALRDEIEQTRRSKSR
jgi:hypothetical protein